MSAQWREDDAGAADATLSEMGTSHLDAVMALENAVYPFPWSRGNFVDSIAAGYATRVLLDARHHLIGYFVAMAGVDEMHLLNITVAPHAQGEGHARRMMDALVALCRASGAQQLWLEVRESNEHARAIYAHMGFVAQGIRKRYYPAPFGRREDAVVMSLALNLAVGRVDQEGPDALE